MDSISVIILCRRTTWSWIHRLTHRGASSFWYVWKTIAAHVICQDVCLAPCFFPVLWLVPILFQRKLFFHELGLRGTYLTSLEAVRFNRPALGASRNADFLELVMVQLCISRHKPERTAHSFHCTKKLTMSVVCPSWLADSLATYFSTILT